MGIFKRLFGGFFGSTTKMKILVVGLDNSGTAQAKQTAFGATFARAHRAE